MASTSTSTPNCSRISSNTPQTSPSYVQQAQQLMQANCRAKKSLLWCSINAAGFSVLLYDLLDSCSERSYVLDYVEFIIMCVFLLNTLHHVVSYLVTFISLRQVPLTERQKKLLGVAPGDPKFPTLVPETKPAVPKSDSRSSLNVSSNWLSASMLSQSHSSPGGSPQMGYMSTPTMLNSSGLNTSAANISSTSWSSSHWSDQGSSQTPNLSMSSSWVYQRGSPGGQDLNNSTNNRLPYTEDPVTDEASLMLYLQQCEAHEKKFASSSPKLSSTPSNLSLLWNSSLNATSSPELLASPASATYHLAPISLPQDTSTGSPGFDTGSASTTCFNEAMWQREGVSTEVLSHWNKNLRQWITLTVLEKVGKEVDAINAALQRLYASEDRIGTTGLERLKKTAAMPQVAQNVPNLSALIPFLEVTNHQDYLVTRIKDLAQGGCMSNFRWNSGGTFNGKPWEENLPTDCAVVLHLLASYLDVQLPPALHKPDKRPFSAQFLSKPSDKPKTDKDAIVIHQARLNPPHFVLFWKNEILEVPQGCNNFLHTLLLFLHRLRTNEDGMLGRMNLGPSGLNMLWIIDS